MINILRKLAQMAMLLSSIVPVFGTPFVPAPDQPQTPRAEIESLISEGGWEIRYGVSQGKQIGLAYPGPKRIDITNRADTGQFDPEFIDRVLAHEYGHVVDLNWMTDELRSHWMGMRNIGFWLPTGTSNDFGSGAGDWAEAVAIAIMDNYGYEVRTMSKFGQFSEEQIDWARYVLESNTSWERS